MYDIYFNRVLDGGLLGYSGLL